MTNSLLELLSSNTHASKLSDTLTLIGHLVEYEVEEMIQNVSTFLPLFSHALSLSEEDEEDEVEDMATCIAIQSSALYSLSCCLRRVLNTSSDEDVVQELGEMLFSSLTQVHHF